MFNHMLLVFFVLCNLANSSEGLNFNNDEKPAPKTWVLLVAGSNGYFNYRHQADICHAYQIVRNHGIPEENIILMMYDDVAYSKDNPTPGILLNHPNGSNVYKNIRKDYVGKDVTPKNFLSVLTGDHKAMRRKGSGKVINSTSIDRIFVNFVDHGAPGILAFPTDELTVGELQKTLEKMYLEKKFAEMVMYIEACESGSMFKNVLPKNYNIFVTTAADFDESSYACYYDDYRNTYLGDLYSVNWMEDTDQRDIEQESLKEQYLLVKEETNTSHVMEYGDIKMSKLPVGEFQGEEEAEKIVYPQALKSPVESENVPLIIMLTKLKKSESSDGYDNELIKEINKMQKQRRYVRKIIGAIALDVAKSLDKANKWIRQKPTEISDLECHTGLVHSFSQTCFNFGQNPYALRFAHVLTNMCNDKVNVRKAVESFSKFCKSTYLLYRTNIN